MIIKKIFLLCQKGFFDLLRTLQFALTITAQIIVITFVFAAILLLLQAIWEKDTSTFLSIIAIGIGVNLLSSIIERVAFDREGSTALIPTECLRTGETIQNKKSLVFCTYLDAQLDTFT
jgi:hypothetical protein